jgi:hypothetical protein
VVHRRSRSARLPLLATLIVLGYGWSALFASSAWSTYTSTASVVGPTVSTGTLAPATGLIAVRGTCAILTSNAVNLSWTATSSTFADGYVVLRSTTSGSGYALIGTVAGRSTTVYVDGTPAFLTTYYYVVQAKRNNWTSPNSGQASVTTPTPLCL